MPDPPLALPLTLSFPCRPAPGQPARRHPVTIGAGWTVDTGHDAELEKVAAALGGGVSCIPALSAALPGLRAWWQRATRQAGLMIRSADLGRRWECADGQFGCCPTAGFADPVRAGAHAREARHVAAATGAERRHLVDLVAGLRRHEVDPDHPAIAGADASALGLVAQAWQCGLAPRDVLAIRDDLAAGGIGTDLTTLLGVVQTGADPAWVARTASTWREAHGGDDCAEVVRWLAWTATTLDSREPAARVRWLATGARRCDITTLSEAGYQAGAAAQVADAWGMSLPGAAQVLARWVSSGYRPHPAHLTGLREVGLAYPPGPPAPAAVTRLAVLVGADGADPEQRTGLAVAIARHGTLQGAAVALVRARGGTRGRRSRPA